jgi:hypothetical protein
MLELLPPPVNDGPEIRPLTTEEYLSLKPRFTDRGYDLPDPSVSTAVGIFDDGKMVGYQVLQLRLHAQPTEIDSGYSHLFSALCRKSEETIAERVGQAWVYVFVESEETAKLAESRGLIKEPYMVYSKFVQRRVELAPVEVKPEAEPEIAPEEVTA